MPYSLNKLSFNLQNNKIIYIDFCQKESDIPLFSQPWYLDTVCGKNGWDILMVQKGDEIAATMPLPRGNKYGIHISRMPLLTKYLGPFFAKKFRSLKQQEKLMQNLVDQIPPLTFYDQNFHTSIVNSLPLHWKNFNIKTRYTFTLDLTLDLEKIFAALSSDYRNNKIPKAKQFIQITSNRSLKEFYVILEQTFQRQNLNNPISFDFLKNYDTEIERNNKRKIFFAVDDKYQIHAANYLIWDKHTAYFHMAADNTNLRSSGAGILLTWHAIKYAKEVLGKTTFDFEGSMLPSIEKVRRDFGAQLTPYFQAQKFSSHWVKALFEIKKMT